MSERQSADSLPEDADADDDELFDLTDELFELCSSESISLEGLREIIKRHGLTLNNVDNYQFFLKACSNERVTEGIIQCLLEYFPDAVSATDDVCEQGALHYACSNFFVTPNIIKLLIDAAPDSVCNVDKDGYMPLHCLCCGDDVDKAAAIEILKILLEKHPETLQHTINIGHLPIHLAARRKSPEFCRVLIHAHPESMRITATSGLLPFHIACLEGSLATVEYFYQQYPDAIVHAAAADGFYPIHFAMASTQRRGDPTDAVAIVQFLLGCDPSQTQIQFQGRSLLHVACGIRYNDLSIEAGIQIIKILFDAHPEAIKDYKIAEDINLYHLQVQAFVKSELTYARQAKDLRLMMTPDDNGQLPLHTALQNNVRLGSIKLLVEGNPSAIRNADMNFAMPLHISCQHHDSSCVVQYLVGLDPATLEAVDRQGNTALHYACRGAKHDTIALLLEKYDAASVSKRNADGKLPINLLWESNEVIDRESVEYTGSIFKLVQAYPEMVSISDLKLEQRVNVEVPRHGKKRKLNNSLFTM